MSADVEAVAAALVVLGRNGLPIEIQEMLMHGDDYHRMPPNVLGKALKAAIAAERERCAMIAEAQADKSFNSVDERACLDIAAAIRAGE